MKASVVFPRVMAITLLAVTLIAACGSGPALVPVTADEIAVPPGATEITAADASQSGALFMPWSFKGDAFTEGPYRRYKIETSETSLTGFKIYVLTSVDSSSIKAFYETELSKSSWKRADDFGGDSYTSFALTREQQAFLVVVHQKGYMYTFLLNK